MKSFSVDQQAFSGPFHLLLELLEKEELAITDLSLATIAQDYLAYIETHPVPAEEIGDFLIVATKLLWLKSKAILPNLAVEQEEGPALADQLRAYEQFVRVAEKIDALYQDSRAFFSPAKSPVVFTQKIFSVPASLQKETLHQACLSLLKRLRPFFSLQQASMERVMSVQEKMAHLQQMLLERASLSFRQLISQGKSRVEVVVSFLALLELAKQKMIRLTQNSLFEDITIKQVK